MLNGYPSPGNVRELRNVIERILIVHDVNEILPIHLPDEILKGAERTLARNRSVAGDHFNLPEGGIDFKKEIGEITLDLKRQVIEQALEKSQGNKTQAARLLGLSRSAMGRQVEKIHQGDGRRGAPK